MVFKMKHLKQKWFNYRPIPVAVQSKAYVCGRSATEVAGANPADSIYVRLLNLLCAAYVEVSAAN